MLGWIELRIVILNLMISFEFESDKKMKKSDKNFLLLGWIELEIALLTRVFWIEIESEKLVKNIRNFRSPESALIGLCPPSPDKILNREIKTILMTCCARPFDQFENPQKLLY